MSSFQAAINGVDDQTEALKKERELRKKQEKEAKKAQAEAKATKKAQKLVEVAENKKDKPKKSTVVKDMTYNELTPPVLQSLDLDALSAYHPPAVESAWYAWWEAQGFFKPELTDNGAIKPEGRFVIVLPPPNVTGSLHIGHALTIAIQDTLIRWNRMKGKTVLYLPGFDHAGIATQSVVEKRLWVQEGKTRHDLGREEFLNLVWQWKEDYYKIIKNQMKRLGCSLDWTREAFTMSSEFSEAVEENFIRLHDEGIIYRANRLVNWDCILNTAVSNLEVDQKEIDGPTMLNVPGYDLNETFEFGVLTSFDYEIDGSDERITVATTRPETMLGDTGIAVHPEDPRYTHLKGKRAKHPFIEDRYLPIVYDSMVDREFGTGAVKITPAHDQNDYEVGLRHHLEFINILNDDGTLNEKAGPWKGVKRFHARKSVVEALIERGLFVDKQPNPMNIPICSRSNDVIEPVMKPQWWLNQKTLAQMAFEAVKTKQIQIRPEVSEREFQHWMQNIQDWCISRQLWWGHQAPVYFVRIEGEQEDKSDDKFWIAGKTEEIVRAKAEKRFPGKKLTLVRDEDVLDTWFSSGLWPFATLGWPNTDATDYRLYYSTSLLETGWDILFFWVARMVMLGLKLTGKVPFTEVYCHPLVRDAQGRKMSKSLGNVIDPIDVITGTSLEKLHEQLLKGNLAKKEIERAKKGQIQSYPEGIPECGTDALRFGLCNLVTGGRDLNLNIYAIKGYRAFCNKLYNATKFSLINYEDFTPRADDKLTGNESLCERWILHRLNETSGIVNKALEDREFQRATIAIHQYWLYQLCDVFIENSKPLMQEGTPTQRRSAQDTLYTALDGGLRLIHPFMPYVTEELWQRLPRRPGDNNPTIMKAAYPVFKEEYDNTEAAREYDAVIAAVKASRSLIENYGIKQNAKLYLQTTDESLLKLFLEQQKNIVQLIGGKKLQGLSVETTKEQPEGCALSAQQGYNVLLLIKGQIDLAEEIKKNKDKVGKIKIKKANLIKQTSNKAYEEKVSDEAKAENAERLQAMDAEIYSLETVIELLQKLAIEDS